MAFDLVFIHHLKYQNLKAVTLTLIYFKSQPMDKVQIHTITKDMCVNQATHPYF